MSGGVSGGVELASAYIQLIPSLRGFGRETERQMGPIGQQSGRSFGQSFGRSAERQTSSVGKKLGAGFGKAFAAGGAVIAAAGIGSLLKGSIEEAREAQKVSATTESIVKATGGAARLSADQIGDLSSALSSKIGVDDEAIQSGANLLLTFKNVRKEGEGLNDIFGRATAAGADLAAAGFGDISGNAKQLGKALNDPLKGISALSRSGVTFTEGQKEQIKGFVKANDLLSAQKIILGEVEAQVGGTAAATATSGEKAAVAFGNLKEELGTALLPVVDRLATAFAEATPRISAFVSKGIAKIGPIASKAGAVFKTEVLPPIKTFGDFLSDVVIPASVSFAKTLVRYQDILLPIAAGIGAMVIAYKAYQLTLIAVGAVTKAFAAAQVLLNVVLSANPIGLIALALVGLGVGLVVAYKKSETFRGFVQKLGDAIRTKVLPALERFGGFLRDKVLPVVRQVITVIARVVTAYVRFGLAVVRTGARIAEFAIGVGVSVAKVVSTIVDGIGGIPDKIIGFVGDMTTAGAEFIGGLFQGMKDAATGIGGLVGDIASAVGSAIVGAINGLIQQLNDALPNKIKLKGAPDINLPNNPFPTIPGYASGTNFAAGGLSLVGERGPELVTLPRGSRVDTAAATARMGRQAAPLAAGGGSGGPVALTITNWQDGTGYLEYLADGRIEIYEGMDQERSRARWSGVPA